MSNEDKPHYHYRKALEHAYLAHAHAEHNDEPRAVKNLGHSVSHRDTHLGNLKAAGNHEQHAEHSTMISGFIKRAEEAITSLRNRMKIKKSEYKGPFNPEKDVMLNRAPGQDTRYNYKPFHELNPAEQLRARKTYGDRHMDDHHYPTNKETGSLEHGTRWKAPPKASTPPSHIKAPGAPGARSPAPQADQGYAKMNSAAQVNINDRNSPHHGKPGVVSMFDQKKKTLAVSVAGKNGLQTLSVNSNQVKPSSGFKKSEEAPENVILIEQSKRALSKIKTRKKD